MSKNRSDKPPASNLDKTGNSEKSSPNIQKIKQGYSSSQADKIKNFLISTQKDQLGKKKGLTG